MEAWRRLKITLISAKNLPDIREHGRMKVYAKISVYGREKQSSVDRRRETNPVWYDAFNFNIMDSHIARDAGLEVVISLYCMRHMGTRDKFIGEVRLPVKALFDNGLTSAGRLTYSVAGTRNGELNVSYSFGSLFLPKPRVNWVAEIARGGLPIVGVMILKGGWFSLTGDAGGLIDILF